MENPANGGVSECRTGWLDTPDDTRKIHDPQAAVDGEFAAEVAYQPCGDEHTRRLAGPRYEHLVQRVHNLGPRPLAELLAEIATATGEPGLIVDRVEAYARLDPNILRILGADKFPPRLVVMEVN